METLAKRFFSPRRFLRLVYAIVKGKNLVEFEADGSLTGLMDGKPILRKGGELPAWRGRQSSKQDRSWERFLVFTGKL